MAASTLSRRAHVPDVQWSDLAELDSLADAVQTISRGYDFALHPYFEWARDPRTTRESFRGTQARFRFAVEGWSQALSAVLARIPRLELRRGVAKNVAEEHGDALDRSHKASFHRYLLALGATDSELCAPCPIAVRAFQQATTNFCLIQPYEAGAAALGIIEHLYVGISAQIVRLLHERAWAGPDDQDHYALHEELDVDHARDLLELARPAWTDARGRGEVALGLLIGAHHFWQLYLDLLPVEPT